MNEVLDGDIPGMALVAFQMMFAVITPALITGATADRLKFGSYAVLVGFWSVLVYIPAAKWVFNGCRRRRHTGTRQHAPRSPA